jgi:hypothetical protein
VITVSAKHTHPILRLTDLAKILACQRSVFMLEASAKTHAKAEDLGPRKKNLRLLVIISLGAKIHTKRALMGMRAAGSFKTR